MKDYTSPLWSSSALLTVDMQREFSLPEGAMFIPGTSEILPAMARLTRAFRAAGLPIVHIVRIYLEDGSNVDLCRRAAIEEGPAMAPPGSDGSQIVPELLPSESVRLDADLLLEARAQSIGPNEWIIYKSRFGAFYKTSLEEHLRNLGVTTTVMCGCNFPNCPRTTLYEASERDFRIVFVRDAVSGVYEKGLEELRNIGVTILTADKCIEAIDGSA